jgi:hypothetical protein
MIVAFNYGTLSVVVVRLWLFLCAILNKKIPYEFGCHQKKNWTWSITAIKI